MTCVVYVRQIESRGKQQAYELISRQGEKGLVVVIKCLLVLR